MPTYTYEARDARGATKRGTAEGASPSAVADQLRQRGWLVTSVSAQAEAGQRPRFSLRGLLPVRSLDIELGLRQLAVMLRSGLSLLRALQVVPEQARRPRMAAVWRDVARRIQEGSSFADALAAHSCFTNLVVQLARVGEATGTLEPVLTRAATALERRRSLRNSVLSALLYPSFVFLMTIGVTAFVILFLLPKVRDFLAPMGRDLPAMTQLLLDISGFVEAYAVQGVILVFALVAGVLLVRTWPPGRRALDALTLRIPIIGRVAQMAGTVTVARGLKDLLASGVTLLEALRTTEMLVGNRHLRARLAGARERVLQGDSPGGALAGPGGFEPMLAAMVTVGEQAGTLDDVLGEVATYCEEELQALIRTFSTLIEPVIIVVVGGIVGFVYVSVFMALFAAY